MYALVGDALLWEENSVKLLGLIIESELTFNSYVRMIVKNFTKAHVPSKTSKYYIGESEKRFI